MSYTKPTISDYNANPPPDDASETSLNTVRWSNHITKIGDPLKSYLDAVNNATESAWNDLASTATVSDGAALVKTKAGNSTGTAYTGAFARTQQDYNDDRISVLEFIDPDAVAHSTIRDGTNTTDLSTYIQAAITRCIALNIGTLYFPSGTYLVESAITIPTRSDAGLFNVLPSVSLVGDYQQSIISVALTTGTAFSYTQTLAGDFHLRPVIKGLSFILKSGVTSTAVCFSVTACYGISFENCQFRDIGGDVLKFVTSADGNGVFEPRVHNCWFSGCDAWGVNISPDTGTQSIATVEISHNRFENCGTGAIRMSGYGGVVANNVIANTTATDADIKLYANTGVQNQNWIIENNWLEKGAVGAVLLESAINCRFERNHIIYNNSSSGAYGFKLVGTGVKERNIFENNRFVIDSSITFVAYQDDANSDFNKIIDTYFQVFSGGGLSKYDIDQGSNWSVTEDGEVLLADRLKYNATTVTDGAFTPNLLTGPYQRVTITTTASLTINVPTAYKDNGRELILRIVNSSGSAVTPSFGSGWAVSSVPNIANGGTSAVRFFYDTASAAFIQVGAWSA